MLLLGRLPSAPEFVSGIGWGAPALEAAAPALRSFPGRAAVAAGSLLLLAGALAALVARAAAVARGGPWRTGRAAAGAGGALLCLWALRHGASRWLDLVINAVSAPETFDLAAPLVAWAGASLLAWGGFEAVLELWGWGLGRSVRRRVAAFAAALAALEAAAASMGAWTSIPEAAGIPARPSGAYTLVILTEAEVPRVETRSVAWGPPGGPDASADSLSRLEEYWRRGPGVHGRAVLRHLYEGYAALLDAGRMRRWLLEARRTGDSLAGLLLAENLCRAPVDSQHRAMLEALSDERRWRLGAAGAATLAMAWVPYDAARAAAWRGRASVGPGAVPAGLLPAPEPAAPGRVEGRLSGASVSRVALYARDPAAVIALSPALLAASAEPDSRGRFAFEGLQPGDYALVLAVDGAAARVDVRGHRGDIRVPAGGKVVLPPLILTAR